ncbi:hypothetical protein BRADI_2g61454v3 [Brachypodium distachyon]|uniref:Uncharacterized protein n=1 Tax=Brachypodium distachyon TaxID=15368 RepID=A0A2K2DH93_BRADI|nr:hypothetical protein BRADI_2g61454v3 [Brachypodium distachyon]PNT73638.1 hypothetical protein BRADI_2g61454v3 [Brachypodium distachyon]PNT73639.1 hypothetical protein BRADI_2g61454v3 [Brachypodium distachyon]PNT73640.1 hypothetical protein BRADI_2g61454v3 [Brachypodium distachyon]
MALASVQPTRAAHRQSISSPIEVSLAGEGGQRPVSPPRRRRPSRRRRFLGQVYGDPFAAARPDQMWCHGGRGVNLFIAMMVTLKPSHCLQMSLVSGFPVQYFLFLTESTIFSY